MHQPVNFEAWLPESQPASHDCPHLTLVAEATQMVLLRMVTPEGVARVSSMAPAAPQQSTRIGSNPTLMKAFGPIALVNWRRGVVGLLGAIAPPCLRGV
jgi:hypothetical protein